MAPGFLPSAVLLGVFVAGWATSAQGDDPDTVATVLTGTPVDLGTLGGGSAQAAAIDGDLVVGSAQTASGAWHAFVMDLGAPQPVMVDLGTLGGRHSSATDVSGHLVVGIASVPHDSSHVFVYDLGAPDAGMVDTGVIARSQYGDGVPYVDDGLVAGQTAGRHGRTVAFSYDTLAPEPRVHRYGTLGGWDSAAFAVDDGLVVGFAHAAGDERRPFVVDARADEPEMIAIGPENSGGSAYDVDGGVVVGSLYTRAGGAAFAYDVNEAVPAVHRLGDLGVSSFANAVDGTQVVGAARIPSGKVHPVLFNQPSGEPTVEDLGTLGGRGTALEVDAGVAVGYSWTPTRHLHGFAADLSGTTSMTDLGTLPGYEWSRPTDVDNRVVVGVASASGVSRAVAWVLGSTELPLVRFSRFRYPAEESAESVEVTLHRVGSTSDPATVGVEFLRSAYRPGAPGKDFGAVPSEVSFAAGQSAASFAVPLVQDGTTESWELIGLRLRDPEGLHVGAGHVAAIRIPESDLRPDSLVRAHGDPTFVGDDVFNTTGTHQSTRVARRPGETQVFDVDVCNDPLNRIGRDFYAPFVLTADSTGQGSRTRFFRRGTEVTEAVRSPEGLKVRIRTNRCVPLRLQTHVLARAGAGSVHSSVLTASWAGDGPASDTVRTLVRVKE